MIKLKWLFQLPLLFLFTAILAQENKNLNYLEVKKEAEERYGPSADLYNGEKYQNPYRLARGNPFFELATDARASVQIKDKEYDNQTVKYDMYNQAMILVVNDSAGGPGSIVLKNEWLDHLHIGDFHFKLFVDANGTSRFGQVIYEGKFSCIYFWEKRYLPDMHSGGKTYFFSDPVRQTYIITDQQVTPYKGNGSFLKCFDRRHIPQIKSYIKERHIRVKRATDQEMHTMMGFIHELS